MNEANMLELVDGIRQIVDRSAAADSVAASRSAVPLDPTEVAAIRLIGARGVVRMRDLAKGLAISPSSSTALIDRLVKKDLVTRERNEADRRVVTVSLATQGKRIFSDATQEHLRLCEEMFAQFNQSERKVLLQVMRSLAEPSQGETEREATGIDRRPGGSER